MTINVLKHLEKLGIQFLTKKHQGAVIQFLVLVCTEIKKRNCKKKFSKYKVKTHGAKQLKNILFSEQLNKKNKFF